MTHQPVGVGVIGCGTISGAYFRAAGVFPGLELVACADLNPAAAARAASEWGLEAVSVPDLLARDDVGLVLNLTVPQVHAEVTLEALRAGKHVYLEKPLALTYAEGEQVVATARELGLRVGCAPDTFLGAGLQTCRALLDRGELGRVVAGTAFMMGPGHELWHPNPDFYYHAGGRPGLRYGAVLPHGARAPARAGPARQRGLGDELSGAHHSERTPAWAAHHGRGADARVGNA